MISSRLSVPKETKELLKAMEAGILSQGEFDVAAGNAAKVIAAEARSLAPIGIAVTYWTKKRGLQTRKERLKDAIHASWGDKARRRSYRRTPKGRRASNSMTGHGLVAVDYRIAPHAHLVEYGTATRTLDRVTAIRFPWGWRRVDSIKPMPAQSFMRKAFDTLKNSLRSVVGDDLAKRMKLHLDQRRAP